MATDSYATIEDLFGPFLGNPVFSLWCMPRLYITCQWKKNTGHKPQEAWCQGELIGSKLPVIK
jgi:hypothetical protein